MSGASIDHLVVAGGDLDRLIARFEQRTGVRAAAGGSHPGVGTRNALVALGGPTYLELIAPDPGQARPAAPRPFGIDDLSADEDLLVTFAAAVDDLDAAVAALDDTALRSGTAPGSGPGATPVVALGPVVTMSRTRPDGVELRWRLTTPPDPRLPPVVPFLIEWGDTPHPSAAAPGGCGLRSLVLHHPASDLVAAAIDALAFAPGHRRLIDVQPADQGSISARLSTPNGPVSL